MRWTILSLVGLGCVLRLTGLAVHSLWFDECATVHVATAADPLAVLLGDRHPPLSFLVLRQWIGWFGEDDGVLRALPATISCISLLAFAALAHRRLAPGAALLATAVQATAPFSIWYGQEVRMYVFVEAATSLALLGVDRVAAGRSWSGAAAIAAATSVALGSHYFGGVVALQVAVAALVSGARASRRWLPIAAAAAGALPWAWWMSHAVGEQLAAPWAFQARLSLVDLLQLPVRFVLVHLGQMSPAVVYVVAALVGLGLLRALWVSPRDLAARHGLMLVATPILLALSMALVLPPNFAPNYLISAAPCCVLVVAHGLWRLPGRLRWAAVLLPCATTVGTLELRQANLREDYRAACAELQQQLERDDRIVAITGTPEAFSRAPLRHYLRDVPDLEARLVDPEAAAMLLAGRDLAGRIHAIWRASDYALPQLDALRAAGTVARADALRVRIQHLVFVPRR